MPRTKIVCPDDETPCLEVRWVRGADVGSAFPRVAMYPKPIPVEGAARFYGEYRFYCPTCRKEWVYYSTDHSVEPVPDNPQFVYDPQHGVLTPRAGGELRLHVQAIGSPGAGKSVLLTHPLVVQRVEE